MQYRIRYSKRFEWQKCRSGSWVAPSKRKGGKYSWSGGKRVCRGRGSPKEFGFMPTPTSLTNHITPNQCFSSSAQNMEPQHCKCSIPFPHLSFKIDRVDHTGLHFIDAHSASPNQIHNYFDDFPNVDSVIQSFCAFEEAPITYNQMPLMSNANTEKLENTSENRDDDDCDDDDDGKNQVVVKKEEEN